MVVAALVLALVSAACFLALTLSLAAPRSSTPRRPRESDAPVVVVGAHPRIPQQRTVHVESVVVTAAGETRRRPVAPYRTALPTAPRTQLESARPRR